MTPEQARADERAKVVAFIGARIDALPTMADGFFDHETAVLYGDLCELKGAIQRGDHDKEQG